LLLVIVLNGLQAVVPCVGWVFPAIAGMVGLGAVILTRFGTQPYPQAAPFEAAPPPPAPAVPAPPAASPLPAEVDQPSDEEPPQEELPPAI